MFRCFLWSLSWAELSSCLVLHRKFLTTSVPWRGSLLELRRTGRSQNLWAQLGEIWELQPLWILSKKTKRAQCLGFFTENFERRYKQMWMLYTVRFNISANILKMSSGKTFKI